MRFAARRDRRLAKARSIFKNAVDALEQRRLLTVQAHINFGPYAHAAAPGYYTDIGEAYGTRWNGLTYGWDAANSNTINRASPSDLRAQTNILTQPGGTNRTWEIAVPNGSYDVRLTAGDSGNPSGVYLHYLAEGVQIVNYQPVSGAPQTTGSATVNVTDGRLTITNGSSATNNRIAYIEITSTGNGTGTPSAPTSVVATAASPTSVDVRWRDQANNEEADAGYRIERRPGGGGSWTLVGTAFGNAELFTDTTAAASTSYVYRVRAQRAGGSTASAWVESGAVTTPATGSGQTSYFGTNPTAPFFWQAEDFDVGGSGVAWADTSSGNAGGWYRSGGVDIAPIVDGLGGHFIGWTQQFENVEYTLNVASSASYRVELSVATPLTGSTIRVSIGGVDRTGQMSVPSTGSFQSYTRLTSGTFTLPAATGAVMQVSLTANFTGQNYSGHLDWVRLLPAEAPGGLSATATSAASVNLSWLDHASNETGYQIERSLDNNSWSLIHTTGANATSWTDTTTAGLTRYFYRVRAALPGSTFSIYTPSTSVVTPAGSSPEVPTPTPPPSGGTGGGDDSAGTGSGGAGHTDGADGNRSEAGPESDAGVRYFDGAINVTDVDLVSEGFGFQWGQSRSWSNAVSPSSSVFGNGWMVTETPRLVQSTSGGQTLTSIVFSGTEAWTFKSISGNAFEPLFDGYERLRIDGSFFEFTDTLGNRYRFNDFSSSQAERRGQFETRIDQNGVSMTVHSRDGSGRITELRRSGTLNGQTSTESWNYTYNGSGQVETVKLSRSGTFVRRVDYTYYGANESYGNVGDLKRAIVRGTDSPTAPIIDARYYRYYKPGETGGYAGALRYVVGPDGHERLGGVTAVDAASNTTLAVHADRYFEYDSSRRVTFVRVRGAGESGGSTPGLGVYTYAYSTSANADGFNNWKYKTTETTPDGGTRIVYGNHYGQVLAKQFTPHGSSQQWIDAYRYDAEGRMILAAAPSAVSGLYESSADLLNQPSTTTADLEGLRNNEGLINAITYNSNTTVGQAPYGNLSGGTLGSVEGFERARWVQRGESGTPIKTSELFYQRVEASLGGQVLDFYPVFASDRFPAENSSADAQFTYYTHLYPVDGNNRATSLQPRQTRVWLPFRESAKNGPAAEEIEEFAMDAFGRVTWHRDAAGFLTYNEFDLGTGAMTRSIRDVATSRDADNNGDDSEAGGGRTFSGRPLGTFGFTSPSGNRLHLTKSVTVDGIGRATQVTDAAGHIDYYRYNDPAQEVRIYRGWISANNRPTLPTEVIRHDRANGFTERFTMRETLTGVPSGTETVANVQTLSRSFYNTGGQITEKRDYFAFPVGGYSTSATLGTASDDSATGHFHRTTWGYSSDGDVFVTVSPSGTKYYAVQDGLDRIIEEWVGTDDTSATQSNPAGSGGANNMTRVASYAFDGGGVGDSNLTQVTRYPGGSAANRVSNFHYDWRNRLVARKDGVQAGESTSLNVQRPIQYFVYDNLDRVVEVERYDGDNVLIVDANSDGVPDRPSASLLRARNVYVYDQWNQLVDAQQVSVDPSSGTTGNTLSTKFWYDPRGLLVKTDEPGGLVKKTAYDGAARPVKGYVVDDNNEVAYTDALNVDGDDVLEQVESDYDANDNVIRRVSRLRFHDQIGGTATGELGTPTTTTGTKARVYYETFYYDRADRLTDHVDAGTNGGAAYTRETNVPARSDTRLVTSRTYNDSGWLEDVIDPRGITDRTSYDRLGRITQVTEARVDDVASDGDDRITRWTYNGLGDIRTMRAVLPGTNVFQETTYIRDAVKGGSESDIATRDVLTTVRYPNLTDGTSSTSNTSQEERYRINALGETRRLTDRNGTTREFSFDVTGRLIEDDVTSFGSGVDQTVDRLSYMFDSAGRAFEFTSRNAAGSVLNQVRREYNGFGQLTREESNHDGAVTGSGPAVRYAYSEGASSSNHSRVTRIAYPDTARYDYEYLGAIDSSISRVTALTQRGRGSFTEQFSASGITEGSGGTSVSSAQQSSQQSTPNNGVRELYTYLGLSTVLERNRPEPNVELTYIGASTGDAGDQYLGLDRFGRIVDQRWDDLDSTTDVERFTYGYDRNGNRTYRENLLDATKSEFYGTYDNLDRLTSFQRGTLNGTKTGLTGSASRSQAWTLDALGNWNQLTQTGGGSNETRTHNRQNQITSGSTTHSNNGEMTRDQNGQTYVYDAWGRLVAVDPDGTGSTPAARYEYDALRRRIQQTSGGSGAVTSGTATTDLYYSNRWQVLEERVNGQTTQQYLWSPGYVDELVLRERDTDVNGANGLEERLYAQQDANFNVTSLMDAVGAVVERYVFDAYGAASVLNANWSADADGASDVAWVYLFQGGRSANLLQLVHFRTRDSNTSLGRWTQQDRLEYVDGSNTYQQIISNPISLVDPLGTQSNNPRDRGINTGPLGINNTSGRPVRVGPNGLPRGQHVGRGRYTDIDGNLIPRNSPSGRAAQHVTRGDRVGAAREIKTGVRHGGQHVKELQETAIRLRKRFNVLVKRLGNPTFSPKYIRELLAELRINSALRQAIQGVLSGQPVRGVNYPMTPTGIAVVAGILGGLATSAGAGLFDDGGIAPSSGGGGGGGRPSLPFDPSGNH